MSASVPEHRVCKVRPRSRARGAASFSRPRNIPFRGQTLLPVSVLRGWTPLPSHLSPPPSQHPEASGSPWRRWSGKCGGVPRKFRVRRALTRAPGRGAPTAVKRLRRIQNSSASPQHPPPPRKAHRTRRTRTHALAAEFKPGRQHPRARGGEGLGGPGGERAVRRPRDRLCPARRRTPDS